MSPIMRRADGVTVNPVEASIPIMKEIVRGKLKIIGTGFYITRYGMFLTAKHVLDELIDDGEGGFSHPGCVLHMTGEGKVYLRLILSIARHTEFDVGLGQADNFQDRFPDGPLMNLRCKLNTSVPPVGTPVVTYAYPENEVLDFTNSEGNRAMTGDYYEGRFLEYVTTSDNPFIPYPHYSTSIEIRSGASGGPVWAYAGNIVGINCRGWDFRGAEFEGSNLSSIVPIRMALAMTNLPIVGVPKISWEYSQIPEDRRVGTLSFAELIHFGHVDARASTKAHT